MKKAAQDGSTLDRSLRVEKWSFKASAISASVSVTTPFQKTLCRNCRTSSALIVPRDRIAVTNSLSLMIPPPLIFSPAAPWRNCLEAFLNARIY